MTPRTGCDSLDASSRETPGSGSRNLHAADPSAVWKRCVPLLCVVCVATIVMFYNLGGFSTLSSHEGYVAVSAREMVRSGDWVVPRFGGLPRLKKPPVGYWVAAASARLFGEWSEWTMRFPAAVFALALTGLMGWWAARRYGRTAGIGAALVQCTSVYVMIFARKAEVDMLLLLLCTGCMFLIAEQPEGESRRRTFLRWTGIYALLSLAWLCKFHYGPAMVLAPCVVFYAVQRRFRDLRHLANPLGLLLFAAAVVIWPALVVQRVPQAWEIWETETVGRAVGELGNEPLWYYLPVMLWMMLPWTATIVSAIPQSWRRAWKERDPHERFLWIWLFTHLAIVTVSAKKHQHYILAALPVFSLIVAPRLALLGERIRQRRPLINRWETAGSALACLGTAAALVIVGLDRWPYLARPLFVVAAILGVGGLAATALAATRKSAAGAYVAMAVFLACYIGATGWIVPVQDHKTDGVRALFAATVRDRLAGDREVHVFQIGKDKSVFYLGEPVQRVRSAEGLKKHLARNGRLLVFSDVRQTDSLEQLGQTRILRTMRVPPDAGPPDNPPLVLAELAPKRLAAESPDGKSMTR